MAFEPSPCTLAAVLSTAATLSSALKQRAASAGIGRLLGARLARNMLLQLLLAATIVHSAAAAAAPAAPLTRPAAPDFKLAGAAPPAPPPAGCHGGPCGGMALYPVGPGIEYYAEFDVPGKPKKTDGICFYIYFNIFFSGKGDGGMNQCVPPSLPPDHPTTELRSSRHHECLNFTLTLSRAGSYRSSCSAIR